jgi:transglutaminase-like putative cysteine protease
MARLSRAGLRDQDIRNLAASITREGFLEGFGIPNKDYEGEAARLLDWVRANIRYVRDTTQVELLHYPQTILETGTGDCDDMAILLSSLLETVGHPTRFIAVAFEPDIYSHVWVQDYIDGEWVDLEPTEDLPLGETVPLDEAVSFMHEEV